MKIGKDADRYLNKRNNHITTYRNHIMNAEVRHMREMLKETLSTHKFALVAAKSNGRMVAIKLSGYAKEECYKKMPTTVGATSHVWLDVDGGLYTWAIHHATFIKYVDTLPTNERVEL